MLAAAASIPVAETGAEALRNRVLSGRSDRPDAVRAVGLARFLDDDQAALAVWFGDEAARLRADPTCLGGLVDRDIAALDVLMAEQLDAILHHPRLQRFEGSWRGLAWLVRGFEPGHGLRFALLSASWADLDRDLARAIEFDQSHLFRMIYENEFGHAGGEPFGLLVVDQEVRHRPAPRTLPGGAPIDDVQVMSGLASIAAAAFVPIVVAAAPALLGVDRFEDLTLSNHVTATLGDIDHARWRSLTMREEARFLCVTMPRVLARPRWDADGGSQWYDEYAPTAAQRTWSTAGYAFAATVGRAHVAHRWPGDVRGVPADRVGGGLVLQLPAEDFRLGAATTCARASIDLALTDRQERDVTLAGLMPLNTLPFGDAAFTSVHSLQARVLLAPGQSATPEKANRQISSEISAMLCVSRFAHYIKIIGRELTGSLAGAPEIQRRLQSWLLGYVNSNVRTDSSGRARHPLLSARVEVAEVEGRPGSYGCIIYLQPFFQLDDASTVFRLVTGFVGPRQ